MWRVFHVESALLVIGFYVISGISAYTIFDYPNSQFSYVRRNADVQYADL
jgi:cytochrome bd-type quinol oxidase subunit 1